MIKYIVIIITLFLASCKLFSPDNDTTSPIVNLTIAGGNEISREVTLYLDIEDDSKIDYVSVMIDDSIFVNITSNFDTVVFTVNEFEYIESEDIEELGKNSLKKITNSLNEIDVPQLLYVKVYDTEGNVGESKKQEVIITEFPGWRKYYKFDYGWGPYSFLVDYNGLVWNGFWDGCKIYDPEANSIRELEIPPTDDFSGSWINDIALIEGSRVWFAADHRIVEYHYDIDKWLQLAVPPPDSAWGSNYQPYGYPAYIWSIAVDANYNVYIGTEGGQISRYNGAEFKQFRILGRDVNSLEVHPNGTVYYFSEGFQQSYIVNDTIIEYDDFPYEYHSGQTVIIDASGIVWIEPGWPNYGCAIYNGSTWNIINTERPRESIFPLLGAKNGIVYAEIGIQYSINEYGNPEFKNQGIAVYDGTEWTYWRELDTPFNSYGDKDIPYISTLNPIIDEAPNGDIWIVLGSILWRYRPSLGGYP